MADEFVPVALADEQEDFTPVAVADEENEFVPVEFAEDEAPVDTPRVRREAFRMLNDAQRLSPRLQRDVADESSGVVGGTMRAGKNVLGGIAETVGEAVTNPLAKTEAFTMNELFGEGRGGKVAEDLKVARDNVSEWFSAADPEKTRQTLDGFIRFFEGNGITDGKQMMEVLKDSIRENTWDPTSDDNARVLSDGSLRVNPKFVALPDAQAGIDAIMAAPVDDATRQQEIGNFKAARKRAAAVLNEKTRAFDEDYRAYADAQAAKGVTDPEQVFFNWPGLDRNWIESSWDVVRDTVAEAGRGIAQTARGAVAGAGEKLGLEGLVEGVGRDMLASAEKSAFTRDIAAARGQEGAIVSTGKELGNTVLQMVPMFAGAGTGRLIAGAAEAGTARRILGNVVAGGSVYGYAGAQGYSSIMQQALDSAQRDAEMQGRELTGGEINATVEKFQGAALANGLQTAILAKLLPEGAEKAALNGIAAQAGRMTGRDVFAAMRAKYGADGVRAAVMSVKPELVEFAKQAYRAGKVGFKDEAIEEGVNQFLEGTIVKMSGADPDKTWDQIGQETWTGTWMGGVVGGGLPVATQILSKTDPAERAARQLASAAQTEAPAAAEAAMEPLTDETTPETTGLPLEPTPDVGVLPDTAQRELTEPVAPAVEAAAAEEVEPGAGTAVPAPPVEDVGEPVAPAAVEGTMAGPDGGGVPATGVDATPSEAPLMPSIEQTVTPGTRVTREDGMRGEIVSESDGDLQVEWSDGSTTTVREDQLKSRSTNTTTVVRNRTRIHQSTRGGTEVFTVMQADENGKESAVESFKGETDEEVQRAYDRARAVAESRARSKNHAIVIDDTISGGGKQIPVAPAAGAEVGIAGVAVAPAAEEAQVPAADAGAVGGVTDKDLDAAHVVASRAFGDRKPSPEEYAAEYDRVLPIVTQERIDREKRLAVPGGELMTSDQWVATGNSSGTQWSAVFYPAIQAKKPVSADLLKRYAMPKGYVRDGDILRPRDLSRAPEDMVLDELTRAAEKTYEDNSIQAKIESHVGAIFDPAAASLEKLFREKYPELRKDTEKARELLRRKFGETVTVYRAEDVEVKPEDRSDRNIFSWSLDEKIAKDHLDDGPNRRLVSREVPVDLIEWYGNWREHEVLVDRRKLEKLDSPEPLKAVRAKDFETSGVYEVTTPAGTRRIYRDPESRAWLDADRRAKGFPTSPFPNEFLGYTKVEALQRIAEDQLTSAQGQPEAPQPAPPVQDKTTAPQPYSPAALKETFDLSDEQSVAVDALVQAMGLDTSRIQLKRGGTPGAGAMAQETDARDAEYLAAVERGDMETAQRMVDEAAKAAGYITGLAHGTRSARFDVVDLDRSEEGFHVGTPKAAQEAASRSSTSRDRRDRGKVRLIPISVKGPFLEMKDVGSGFLVDWVGAAEDALPDQSPPWEDPFEVTPSQFAGWLKSMGYSGIRYVNEVEDPGSVSYALFDSGAVKSTEPVTRDADGNVIPLSKRFNPESPSILYQGDVAPSRARASAEADIIFLQNLIDSKYESGDFNGIEDLEADLEAKLERLDTDSAGMEAESEQEFDDASPSNESFLIEQWMRWEGIGQINARDKADLREDYKTFGEFVRGGPESLKDGDPRGGEGPQWIRQGITDKQIEEAAREAYAFYEARRNRMLGAAPAAPLFQFAGESANVPQFMRDSLDTAKAMAAAGKSSAEIRAVTGWFPGKYDGKMRWEIPDEGAKLKMGYEVQSKRDLRDLMLETAKAEGIALTIEGDDKVTEARKWGTNVQVDLTAPDAPYFVQQLVNAFNTYPKFGGPQRPAKTVPLDKVLNHSKLFTAYPALGQVNVEFAPSLPGGVDASFDVRENLIRIKADLANEQTIATLLHEIQHWIQEREGFAKGSSASQFAGPNMQRLVSMQKLVASYRSTADLVDRFDGLTTAKVEAMNDADQTAAMAAYDGSKDRWMSAEELRNKADALEKEMDTVDFDGSESYRRTAGEIEAREIEVRAKLTPEQRAATEPYSSENIAPEAAITLFQDTRSVTERSPSIRNAAIDYRDGKITQQEYLDIVKAESPARLFTRVPAPASNEDLQKVDKGKRPKIGAADNLPEGTRVGLRLDIPALRDHGVGVVTIHQPRSSTTKGSAGSPIGYASVARVRNAKFATNSTEALKIATGEAKQPLATIEGEWVPATPAEVEAAANEAINDPAWVQVGMNPIKHSWFYDRADMRPVISADEILQVGGAVFAKNPVYASPADPRFMTKQGVMFQNRQDAKGSFEQLPETGDILLRGLTAPDVSTAVHELAHAARRTILNRSVPAENRAGITDEDIAVTEEWAGAKDGNWTVAAEEKFARGLERYLREGKAPVAALQGVFDKIGAWLRQIYANVSGSAIDVEISPAMRAVFDKLVSRNVGTTAETLQDQGIPAPAAAENQQSALESAPASETAELVALDEQIEQDLEPEIPAPEFTAPPLPPDQSPTSIKHAQVDADRVRLGLPPRFRPNAYTDQAAWDRAIAAEDAWSRTNESGTAGSALLDRLIREGPRALTKDESALLLHEKLLREDAVEKAQAALNRAGTGDRKDVQDRVKAALDRFTQLADYVDAAGSKSGLSLQARKLLVNRDYSLASVAREMHAAMNLNAKEPVPWTDADQKRAAEVAKKLQETQARLDQLTEENTELTAAVERLTRDVEQAQAKLGKQVRETRVRKLVKEKLDPLVAEAKARLEARGKVRPSQPPPPPGEPLMQMGGRRMITPESRVIAENSPLRKKWVAAAKRILGVDLAGGDIPVDKVGYLRVSDFPESIRDLAILKRAQVDLDRETDIAGNEVFDALTTDFEDAAWSDLDAGMRNALRSRIKERNEALARIKEKTKGLYTDSEILNYVGELPSLTEMDLEAMRLIEEVARPLYSGLPPETAQDIKDMAIVGAGWLVDKALTVSEFGAKLVSTFGDWVKDHIDAVFSQSQSLFTETAASVSGGNAPTPEQVRDSIDPEEELTKQDVWELARAHVIAGARGRNVLENVFNDLSPLFPDLTRDRVAELFTDYGKTTRPSQNETAKELQRVKSLERIALKLADVRAKQMPKRTGFQRGEQDAEIRELEKQFREEYRALEEEMRAKGIPFEDSERRLKTALGAVKRRMLNEIEEIERAIASGQARNAAVRQPVQYDQEAIDLRARLEAKRAEYDAMFSKETTRDKRVAAVIKSLDRQIAEEEKMLADGILKKAKGETVTTPEIETRRERLRRMRQNRRDLYAAQNPDKIEAEALAAAKRSAQRSIERLGAAVASGDVAVKRKDPAYTPDAELLAMIEARETLSDMVAEMRRALPVTPEKEAAREKRMLAAAEKTLEDLDAKLAAGDLSVKAPRGAAAVPASVQAVRAKIKAANRQLDARRREAGAGPYSMDAKIQRQLGNVNKRLAEYQRRIREKDFTRKTAAKPVTSPEILDAEFEAAKAKAEYQEMLNRFKLRNATFGQKAGYYLFSTNNLLKLLTLGFDIGVLTRQLGTTYQSVVRDLGMFAPTAEGARLRADGSYVARTIRAGVQAFMDPKKELEIYKAVSTRPNAGWDKAAGLVFGAPFDDQAGTREDVPTANFIEQIPWWVWPAIAGAKVALVGVSPPVAVLLIGTSLVQKRLLIALDRAQRAMTNQSRALWFDHALENLPEAMQTAESAKVLGTAIMVGTGRGVLPKKLEGIVPAANMILLATRFYVSRIQSIIYGFRTAADVGTGFLATPKATKAARQEVAKMYARSVTGRALLLMLAAMAFGKSLGGDDEEDDQGVVLDPFNPDFGRIKLAEKTKLDFMSGINGFMGVMARVAFERRTDPETGRKDVLSPSDMGREVTNFFASKRNLQVSYFWNLHKGEFYGGKPANFANALEEATTAIIVNDTVTAVKELGPLRGFALTMLMLTGAGTAVGDTDAEEAQRKADKAAAALDRKRREAELNQ